MAHVTKQKTPVGETSLTGGTTFATLNVVDRVAN